MFKAPVTLQAVIPVGNIWKPANNRQEAMVKHYRGRLGNCRHILIDTTDKDTPVLEAGGRKYPMMRSGLDHFILPQVDSNLRVRINGLSACMYLI